MNDGLSLILPDIILPDDIINVIINFCNVQTVINLWGSSKYINRLINLNTILYNIALNKNNRYFYRNHQDNDSCTQSKEFGLMNYFETFITIDDTLTYIIYQIVNGARYKLTCHDIKQCMVFVKQIVELDDYHIMLYNILHLSLRNKC